MFVRSSTLLGLSFAAFVLTGCRTFDTSLTASAHAWNRSEPSPDATRPTTAHHDDTGWKPTPTSIEIVPASVEDEAEANPEPEYADPPPSAPQLPFPSIEEEPGDPSLDGTTEDDGSSGRPIELNDVVGSIYAAYPLLESAYRERDVRNGQQISAWGAFDTKVKGDSRNQPVGFYRTYRQKIGLERPVFDGGNVFAQYRVGRGQFEPWYEERETNAGGEFKAGFVVPLLQGRDIDERRSELFKAQLDVGSVEPEIRGQLIEFVRVGSFAYWDWLAAGENARIAQELLENALTRAEALQKRVDEGDLEPIAITDNDRLLASRRAKLVDAERKLRQTAIKLSLFLRAPNGTPIVPDDDRLPPRFPDPRPLGTESAESQVVRAHATRPEMTVIEFVRRRAEIDLRQAVNLTVPQLDAGLIASQDVGKPTSLKRDKSRLELEAGLTLEVPLERRKARGKIVQTQAKLAQINAKRRFTMDKIAVEVRNALTAVEATLRRFEQARISLELARRMEAAERTKFDLGGSDLFLLNAREQQTAEAAQDVVTALADHFRALADLDAAIGELRPFEPEN